MSNQSNLLKNPRRMGVSRAFYDALVDKYVKSYDSMSGDSKEEYAERASGDAYPSSIGTPQDRDEFRMSVLKELKKAA